MGKNDRFQRGSGCFTCADCGKRTRATSRDGADSRLCADCFEFAGRQNEHSDDGHNHGPKVEGCPVCSGVKTGKEYASWDGETDMTPEAVAAREQDKTYQEEMRAYGIDDDSAVDAQAASEPGKADQDDTDKAPQEPMKVVRNLLSGKEVLIPVNTPLCCDPSTETFWSM